MFITQRQHFGYLVNERMKKGLRNSGFTVTSTEVVNSEVLLQPENQTRAVEVLDYFIQKQVGEVLNFAPSWTTRILPVIQMGCSPGRPTNLIVASPRAFINQLSTLKAREVSAFCGDMFTSERQTIKSFLKFVKITVEIHSESHDI